ncbi:hypothetical protein ACFYP4_14160 [Streptomyces sp. NPDC005551]|uniref:hypothetical protein n=1 Tax=unclassified Streptomyces TaxID=2593676 RepID=UPI0033D7E182
MTAGEKTPVEQALGRSYTTVDGVMFNVTRLSVEHHPDRTVTFVFGLTVERPGHPDECWVVTLPWDDKSFSDVLASPAPPPDRLRQMVNIVHALLEEWWATKARNRHSAKMGRRIS